MLSEAKFITFLSVWFYTAEDWTSVSRIFGKHSNHYTNVLQLKFYKFSLEENVLQNSR